MKAGNDHDSYDRGNEFEDFVVSMFPADRFELGYRTMTDRESGGRFVEGMEYPDLRFTDRVTEETFWVECKYRSSTRPDGAVAWCDEHQLSTYRDVREGSGHKVYVMIGTGGRPGNPYATSCIDLDDLRFTVAPKKTLDACRIHLRKVDSLRQLEFIASQSRFL